MTQRIYSKKIYFTIDREPEQVTLMQWGVL
jgi:hypothetical protein